MNKEKTGENIIINLLLNEKLPSFKEINNEI